MAIAPARTIAAVTVTATATATTAAFSPAANEILVMVGVTEAGDRTFGTISSSPALTWTSRVTANTAGDNQNAVVQIWTATVGSSAPGSTTVSVTGIGNGTRVFGGSGWSGAQLATTPATHVLLDSTTSSDTITTTGSGSVVVWAVGDWNAVTGAATYRSSASQLYLAQTIQVGAYSAQQAAASAGPQTYGLSAPTGQKAAMAAIEIQASGVTVVSSQSRNVARYRAALI